MSTSIRYLRLSLHLPTGGQRVIGYMSSYGDIIRVSFDQTYIDDQGRPTLSLAYVGETEAATKRILSAKRDVRLVQSNGRLPVYFQNLLPEGHNRARLAQQRNCTEDDEFELLAAAGHDLMGAIEAEPVPPQEGIPDAIRLWHTTQGLEVLEAGFVESPIQDAFSLPGVVTKFSAVHDGRRYVVKRHGEAGAYILKLPSTRHPTLVANEYAGYQLCKALGLSCAEAQIISREDAELPEQAQFDTLLAVKRFDRAAGHIRIHMEEFAQVLQYPPGKKYGVDMMLDYSRALRVLDQLSVNRVQDTAEFIRRLTAFILMGNTDAHLKNWALLYPDGIHPVLAPIYDPVCVAALLDEVPESDYKVNRTIDEKLRTFSWEQMEDLMTRAGIVRVARHMQIARDTVAQAKARWPAVMGTAPVTVRSAVTARLDGGVALAR